MTDYIFEIANRLILILPAFLLGICVGRKKGKGDTDADIN